MIYVLVVISVLGTSAQPTFQEFESKSTCLNALNTIEAMWNETTQSWAFKHPFYGLCVPK